MQRQTFYLNARIYSRDFGDLVMGHADQIPHGDIVTSSVKENLQTNGTGPRDGAVNDKGDFFDI